MADVFLMFAWDLMTSHGAHILGLLVHLLHIVARGQHLVLTQHIGAIRAPHSLLSFAFALFGAAAFVESRVKLS